LSLKVSVLRKRGGRTYVAVDERDNPLQVMFAPFVLPLRESWRTWLRGWLYPANAILRAVLMNTTAKQILRLYAEHSAEIEYHDIPLICKETRQLQSQTNFHLELYNFLDTAPRAYTVVRAMNVFNPSYFTDDMMSTAVINIFRSLREGGAFITGSNNDAGSIVNGTIYRKQQGAFVPVYTSGDGSPIDYVTSNTIENSNIGKADLSMPRFPSNDSVSVDRERRRA
jgi:hypothetical protein